MTAIFQAVIVAALMGTQAGGTNPSFRVVKVTGKAFYKIGLKPEKPIVVGMIPAAARIRCDRGGSVEILRIGDKKPVIFKGTELTAIVYKRPTRDRVHFAIDGLYEIGGSTRRGEISNIVFPLAGSVRPNFAFVLLPEGASGDGKSELVVRYLQSDWKMGEVPFTGKGIQARLNDHLRDYQSDVAGAILEIRMESGGKRFSSSPFSLLSKTVCEEIDKDLAEVDKLYGNALSPEKCVVRAGVLNSYGLRTEAAVELETALALEPNQPDLVVPLALIYLQGGAIGLMNETLQRRL